jgi:hypothetical protein
MKPRCFDPDYDHAAVGRWLRQQAMKGFQRGGDDYSRRYTNACACGVNLPEFPNSVSLILTRDMVPGCAIGWHLSVCCVTDRGYRGFVPAEGAHWIDIVFGPYRGRAVPQPIEDRTAPGIEKDVRHWVVQVDWDNRKDPAVLLEGLDVIA